MDVWYPYDGDETIKEASASLEEPPTQFDTSCHPYEVEVAKDKLTATYIGKGTHTHDVGSLIANRPIPSSTEAFYFEIDVVEAAEKCSVSIGLCSGDNALNRHLGFDADSYGYLSEDGNVYLSAARGTKYGPVFGRQDTVGCGIIFEQKRLFFTKNGKYLGDVRTPVALSGTWYPSVALHGVGDVIVANFGNSRSFRFDLTSFLHEVRQKAMLRLSQIPLAASDVQQLLKDYFLFYGYRDTLSAFERERTGFYASENGIKDVSKKTWSSGSSVHTVDPMRLTNGDSAMEEEDGAGQEDAVTDQERSLGGSLSTRSKLRQSIMENNLADMDVEITDEVQGEDVDFVLKALTFTRYVEQSDLLGAVKFAQEELKSSTSQSHDPTAKRHRELQIQELLGLLAYENPRESPVSYLLSPMWRDVVADSVNAQILQNDKISRGQSRLEVLMRHLLVMKKVLRDQTGLKGEEFSLHAEHNAKP